MQKTQSDVSIDAIAFGFQSCFGEMAGISTCWENDTACGFQSGISEMASISFCLESAIACGFRYSIAEMAGISSRGGHVRAFTYNYVKTRPKHPAPHDLSARLISQAQTSSFNFTNFTNFTNLMTIASVLSKTSPALGSSSFITDATGYAVQHLQPACRSFGAGRYLPFGEPMRLPALSSRTPLKIISESEQTFVDQQNGYDSRYTFSAKEKDDETQYSYFGARYYDSDLSVWLSVDPLSDKYPSLSPYMYCAGNPVVLFDSDGRKIKPVGESATKAMNYFGNKYGPLLQITTDQDKTSGTADDGVYYSRAYFSDRAAFDESFNKGLSDGTYTKKDREEAWTLYNVLVNPDIVEASVIIEGEGSRTYGHSDNEGSSYGGAALITDNSEYSEFVNVFNQKGGIMTKEMTDFLYNQTTVQTSDGVDHTIYPNASGNNWDFFRNGGYQKGQSGQTKGLVMINGTNLNIPAIAKVLLTAASKANSEQ